MHTPGPWSFNTYNTIFAKLEGPGVEDGTAVICSIPDHPSDGTYAPEESTERGWWYSQSEDNAYLIAAAPQLLEALELIASGYCANCGCDLCNTKGCPTCTLMRKSRSVVALAKGETYQEPPILDADPINLRNMSAKGETL